MHFLISLSKNESKNILIISSILSLGILDFTGENNPEVICERISPSYPSIEVYLSGDRFLFCGGYGGKVVTVDELIDIIGDINEKKKRTETVILNSAYTAIISRDSITVGCQTFDLSIVDKLVEARNKVSKG